MPSNAQRTHVEELVLKAIDNGVLSNPGESVLYMDSATHKVRISEDGGEYEDVASAGASITLAQVYPVDSIYISVNAANPATVFGFGTWEAFATGRTLVGVDVGQSEFDAVGKTGGAKTHTLIEAEMPVHTHLQTAHNHTQDAHSHSQSIRNTGTAGTAGTQGGSTANNATAGTTGAATATNQAATAVNQNAGGGQGHNNLQPFITCYFWKRTA